MDDKRAPALCWTFFCESIYEKESKQTNKKKMAEGNAQVDSGAQLA